MSQHKIAPNSGIHIQSKEITAHKEQSQNKFRRNALKRRCGGNHCMVSGSHLKAVELMNILRHPQMQVKTTIQRKECIQRRSRSAVVCLRWTEAKWKSVMWHYQLNYTFFSFLGNIDSKSSELKQRGSL